MANIKIPKGAQQFVNKAIQEAPRYAKAIGEGIPVVIDAAGKKLAPAGKFIAKHWPKLAAGGAGGAVVADDIHQRVKRKQERDRHAEQERLQAQAVRKQDAEIKVLKKEAEAAEERADNLEAINEQLCDALKDSKGGDSGNEEIEETDDSDNRTTD